ncbi:MAG TPA: hypothetical protein VFX50_07890, partial [Gemmatimonadales bacterium]|nr:hypothetical protein [Gemmatimonadales bacterium]
LPVRLLSQDLAQLGLVAVFIAVIVVLLQRNSVLKGRADLDIALPGVFLVAMLWGRLATALAAARRVVEAGFAPAEILAGFRRLLDEREADRARLQTLPHLRARRRRAVRIFWLMIAMALMLLWLVWRSRVQIGPSLYRVPRGMVVTLFSAVTMLGMAFIGLVRNPFRPTVGERLFRVLWMGAFGRGFLRLAARGVARAEAGASSPRIAAPTLRAADAAPGARGEAHTGVGAGEETVRLARLEARVEALEQWRGSSAP